MRIQSQTAGRLDLVRWITLPSHSDERGVLTAIESGADMPFEVKRVFFLHGIRGARGGHAHRDTHEIIVAVAGSCELELSNATTSRTFRLESPTRGVLLGPMLYIRIRDCSPDAIILVIASDHYDRSRSIYDWDEFLQGIADA